MVNQLNNLSKNSFFSLNINIFIALIDFSIILLIAKLLGPIEFGRYIFIISFLKFLGLPILIGYPYFILRKSSFITSNKKREITNLLIRNIYVIAFYIIFLSAVILFFNLLDNNLLRGNFNLLLFGIISIIPILSLNNSISVIIRTSGSEIKGQVMEKLIPSILFIGLTILFFWNYKVGNHSISLFLYSASSILGLIYSLIQIKGLLCFTKLNMKHFVRNVFSDIKESFILVSFQIFMLFNNLFPLIILGFFEKPEIVGSYKLTYQIAAVSGLALHSINKIVQPRFAKSFCKKDFLQIQKIAIKSNRLAILYCFFISFFIFIFYKKFVTIFFGIDFLIPQFTLLIILLSPLFNSLFGSVGSIINMTGNEKVAFKWCGIASFIGLLSCFILIPISGMNGAAFSTLIVWLISGFALWRKSFKLLKVKSSYILDEILKFKI